MANRTCSVDGCGRAHLARGLCRSHYDKARAGQPVRPRTTMARVWQKIRRNGDCWEWTAAKSNGYGILTVDKVGRYAHRFMYEQLVGTIPDGLQIDHLCRNRACCNPDHLEPVTPAENTRRAGGNGAITHCPKGHPYDADNTYRWTDSKGYTRRHCRECNRRRVSDWQERRRAAA